MKNNSIETLPKSNRKIIETDVNQPQTHMYMIVYFPGLVQALH